MQWFVLALFTPILHSISNFVDKILLEKSFKKLSLFVFMIYTTATTVIILPIFIVFGGVHIFQIPYQDICILMSAGVFDAGAIYCYLLALNREEASIVVPFFQLIPIASFILSYAILGETLSVWQMVGSLIIISGATILSINVTADRKIYFRYYIILTMTAMAILMALAGVLFKFVASAENFWISNFWESLGFALFGTIIFLTKRRERYAFYESIKDYREKIVGGVLLSEILTTGGNVVLNYSFLLVPIALARTIEGYQPAFVLIIGILLTKFFPRLFHEKTELRHLVPKIMAIIVIFIGSYLILR